MDGSNNAIAILALVNLIFRYKSFAPGFSGNNYKDRLISSYYDGEFRNGDVTEIRDVDGIVVFDHKDGIPGTTSIFRHGAWEDYLEALPGRLKEAKYERS